MKHLRIAAACLAIAAAGEAHALAPVGRDVMVVAHRACWENGAPEVSVAAIRACEAIGPDIVEIDVRRTRDGALVLMHDASVDRTTNGKGMVTDMTAAQIRALFLRARDGGPDAPLTRERVPTLEEGLKAARGKFIVNLHLYVAAEAEVAAVVRKVGMAGQVTTWVSGGPVGAGRASSQMRGAIGLIPIIKQCTIPPTPGCEPGSLNAYAPYRPWGFYVIPEGKIASEAAKRFLKDTAAALRPAGSRVMASTLFGVDQLPLPALQDEWRKLIDLGADIIMTDHPGALVDLLRSEQSRSR